jgi:hypothetical protein
VDGVVAVVVVVAGAAVVAALLVVTVWPWNACAAPREIRPESPIAPAIIQRLIRDTRASPASRAVVVRLVIVFTSLERRRKKALSGG